MDKRIQLIEFETLLLGHYRLSPQHRRTDDPLERSSYLLLSRLRIQGPMSLRQLSDALGLDVSTLHRQTATLLSTGLVERIPDPDGGIARKFRVTAAGGQRLDRERAVIIEVLAAVTQDWTPEERAEFAHYLERFNSDIERLYGRTWPRPDSSARRSRSGGNHGGIGRVAPATSST